MQFLIQLLLRNPQVRLGVNGIEEVRNHPWLADVEWERIEQKKLKAPFKPIVIPLLPRASTRTTNPTNSRSLKTLSSKTRSKPC